MKSNSNTNIVESNCTPSCAPFISCFAHLWLCMHTCFNKPKITENTPKPVLNSILKPVSKVISQTSIPETTIKPISLQFNKTNSTIYNLELKKADIIQISVGTQKLELKDSKEKNLPLDNLRVLNNDVTGRTIDNISLEHSYIFVANETKN